MVFIIIIFSQSYNKPFMEALNKRIFGKNILIKLHIRLEISLKKWLPENSLSPNNCYL